MTERCAKWEPVRDVAWPCAGISFERIGRALDVVMRFSLTKGAPPLDLKLQFAHPVALRWIDESFAYASIPGSDALPTLDSAPFGRRWTFPLLRVIESSWLPTLGHAVDVAHPEHFVLVTMNDVLHIAAKPDVTAGWAPSHDV